MGIRVPSTLATRKAIYEVDDVDLIRANTENTWPIIARYTADLSLSKSNILLDVGANANLTMSMPYHFDIGPNVFWTARDLNGQVNQLDFIGGLPSPSNTAIVTNTWGAGSFTANVEVTQPDSNLDIFSVNVYSNSDLIANTGTIRKTSRGNFDLVFYNSTADTPYDGRVQYASAQFILPFASNISVLAIGAGGLAVNSINSSAPHSGLVSGGTGGILMYVNNIQLPANTFIKVSVSKFGGFSDVEMFGGGQSLIIRATGGGAAQNATYFSGTADGYSYSYSAASPHTTIAGTLFTNNTFLPYENNVTSTSSYTSGTIYDDNTLQYSYSAGGGAGGYSFRSASGIFSSGGSKFNSGGVTNFRRTTTSDTTRYTWHPYAALVSTDIDARSTLSSSGGGAGGVWKASSVFDSNKYSGFGTGIYGWNGANTYAVYESSPGTYPNWNKPNVELLYGGYGAVLEGNMHPSFKTTTPHFGAGSRPGPFATGLTSSGTGAPGTGVVRIMFDGDKRKFPNVNCGLEKQTTTMLWDTASNTAVWYNGEVIDPDNPYPNILNYTFIISGVGLAPTS